MLLGGKRDEVIKCVLSFWPTRFAMMGRRECGWRPTAMSRSKRKLAKERKNLGVWEMTPDTPHWRSGARQIGLFSFPFSSFLASSPMSIPQNSFSCPRNSKLSPSPYCASQTFFQATRDVVETDGRTGPIQITISLVAVSQIDRAPDSFPPRRSQPPIYDLSRPAHPQTVGIWPGVAVVDRARAP